MAIDAVERTDVGVPLWWIDGPDETCDAWLLFRVGAADETLLTRGITRLALEIGRLGVAHRRVEIGVLVGGSCSGYHLTGDPEDVATAIADVGRSIAMPAMDRIEETRHALVIRSNLVGIAAGGFAASLHFGAGGHGLIGYDDYGLSSVDAAAVTDWMQLFLVGGNAALAWGCEPPPDLSIVLPWGPLVPAPPPVPAAMPTPRCVPTDTADEGASLSVWLADDLTGSAAARAMVGRVRAAAGTIAQRGRGVPVSKARPAIVEVLDGSHAMWVLWLAGVVQADQPTAQLLFDTAWDFADEGPNRRELRAVAADLRAELADEGRLAERARSAAMLELLGSSVGPDDLWPDLISDLDPEDVRQAWIAALDRAVWSVPLGERAPIGAGPWLHELVPMPKKGRRFPPIDRRTDHGELVVSDFVVAEVEDADTGTVVPFSACAGLIDLDDGSSLVYGTNGDMVVIDPAAWVGGDEIIATLHARVPAELQVRSAIPSGGFLTLDP